MKKVYAIMALTALPACAPTESVTIIAIDGQNGQNGINGQSCTVTKTGNVSTIVCANGSVKVYDGTSPVVSGWTITEIVQPCGPAFDNQEIFLRLSNGALIGVYDGGPNLDRLVSIAPGTYQTTDRTGRNRCIFTVTSSKQIINQKITKCQ